MNLPDINSYITITDSKQYSATLTRNNWVVPPVGTTVRVSAHFLTTGFGPQADEGIDYIRVFVKERDSYAFITMKNIENKQPKYKRNLPDWF